MKRYLLTLVFLAGCAPIVSDKPGATQSESNVAQAQCQPAATASEGGYCGCPFYRRSGAPRPTFLTSRCGEDR